MEKTVDKHKSLLQQNIVTQYEKKFNIFYKFTIPMIVIEQNQDKFASLIKLKSQRVHNDNITC